MPLRRSLATVVLVAAFLFSHLAPATAAQLELGERDLTIGSWGADVFALQQKLKSLGYDVAVDGRYGQATWRAVLAFQQSQGLEADGIVGTATALAILQAQQTIPYVVKTGDSLWTIAQEFDTSMNRLVVLNRLHSTQLVVGAVLQVPAPRTYTVKSGDTLSGIAIAYQTSVAELKALNNIRDPRALQAGARLRLPRPPVL